MSISTQYAPQQTRKSKAFTGGIASLADDQLYALQNPFALDGRVSSYPASARGFSVANSYLLTQPDAAMLIDTGFGKDEPTIRAQIEVADRARPAAVDVSAAAQRVHVDQQCRELRRALQRRDLLHQQHRRGAVVRFRRQGGRPRHPQIHEGHRRHPRRHDPARQRRARHRRDAGADPPHRHALALRPRHPHAVFIRHVHPRLARHRDRPLDRHRGRQRFHFARATCARSC